MVEDEKQFYNSLTVCRPIINKSITLSLTKGILAATLQYLAGVLCPGLDALIVYVPDSLD